MFKNIEIGSNVTSIIITLLLCGTISFLSYVIADYNKSVFEAGYTQIILEGKVVWVKADSVVQK